MTRYEAATFALSTWLAKARAPSGDDTTRAPARTPVSPPPRHAKDSAGHRTRRLKLPPSWDRHDEPLDRPSLVMRLWRAIGGGRRP